jgi:hypothetical protein
MRDWNATYVCDDCGASGCKLWRDYQTFLDRQRLRCAPCAAKNQDKPIIDIDDDGFRTLFEYDWGHEHNRSDQIGWLVPAVTTAEGDTFWGYTSCPEDRIRWWRALPTLPSTLP